ncbi:predicted protein [Lichtheimia corymbifera JMRC:FSU:9682]|uniref:Uncharacterized protein n=1 Tax=Lichtheimia corymbifera JMRC:FSU:9682 TaxID=1263082 RepID=A0A068RXW1_9FUNG|nr:predicted protein [Lichtheimia corymbifera JMRC:FSU:9682]
MPRNKVSGIKTNLEDMHRFVVQGHRAPCGHRLRVAWPLGAVLNLLNISNHHPNKDWHSLSSRTREPEQSTYMDIMAPMGIKVSSSVSVKDYANVNEQARKTRMQGKRILGRTSGCGILKTDFRKGTNTLSYSYMMALWW